MSTRNLLQSNIPAKTIPGATYLQGKWVRNPTWLPLTSISSSEQKFTGLYQINRFANFIAFTFNTSGGAQYTVNWGDGSAPVNVNSGTSAFYEYDFNDVDLNNTDGPVTFTASTSRVNRNNHGYTDGMNISFATIVTTTGIVANQTYFVINATTNDFQLSNTIGGSVITLTNDGSGTILPYKQAVVTVTPVSGNLTVGNLFVKHNQSGLINGYSTGWLDIAFAGSYTTLTIGSSATTIYQGLLQQVNILSSNLISYQDQFRQCFSLSKVVDITSNVAVNGASDMFNGCSSLYDISLSNLSRFTTMANMFANATNLRSVAISNTPNVTNTFGMFNNCTNLREISLSNLGNVTNMVSMFQNCYSLPTFSLFDSSKTTNMNFMFADCNSLEDMPILDTSNVTSMVSMFQNCYKLNIPAINTIKVANMQEAFRGCLMENMPLLNTSNVTDMNNMFSGCRNLKTIPLFNTSNVTNMNQMFLNCSSLETIPLCNTAKVTNFASMFGVCTSLNNIPLLNTINATSITSMFNSCTNLKTIPLLNISNVTDMRFTFQGCSSLTTLPVLNTANVSNFAFSTQSCFSLVSIPALDMRKANLQIFSGSPPIAPVSEVNITGPVITFTVANAKLSGTALNNLYTNLGRVGNGGGVDNNATFDSVTNIITKTGHGYANLDAVRFATVPGSSNVLTTVNYYVINAQSNTFQITDTLTGSARDITANGTATILASTITVTGNYGTASDNPAIATGKGWTVTGS